MLCSRCCPLTTGMTRTAAEPFAEISTPDAKQCLGDKALNLLTVVIVHGNLLFPMTRTRIRFCLLHDRTFNEGLCNTSANKPSLTHHIDLASKCNLCNSCSQRLHPLAPPLEVVWGHHPRSSRKPKHKWYLGLPQPVMIKGMFPNSSVDVGTFPRSTLH